jgi:multiple sugar transport system permease protein
MNKVTQDKWRSFFLGNRTHYGVLFNIVLYMLLIAIGFVYLYPLLFMFVTSLKSPSDLLNPMVQWVPTALYTGNYEKAFRVLDYPNTLVSSILISLIPSLIQAGVCVGGGVWAGAVSFSGQKSHLLSHSGDLYHPGAKHGDSADAHLPGIWAAGQ